MCTCAARQTLMFSATFPPPMQKLAAEFMADYIWIGVGRVGSTVAAIEQRLVLASNNKQHKLELLGDALASTRKGARTLVFVKKKSTARWVAKQLRKSAEFDGRFQLTSAEIHGDRSQSQREAALQKFRDGEVQVLVATDVAARGLDIAGVEHVVNFDLGSTPDEFDSYVHRIGRTGRAGNSGLATSFYVPGFEAKVGCGRIAGSLLKLLRESKQVVPQWFLDLPESRSGGRGGGGGGRGGRGGGSSFGGRDIRGSGGSGGGKSGAQQSRQPPAPPTRGGHTRSPRRRDSNGTADAGRDAQSKRRRKGGDGGGRGAQPPAAPGRGNQQRGNQQRGRNGKQGGRGRGGSRGGRGGRGGGRGRSDARRVGGGAGGAPRWSNGGAASNGGVELSFLVV